MGERWYVKIAIWPHSTGRGQDVDQIQAGSRTQVFEVAASDVATALKAADLIVLGIACNPIVWQAPIVEVRQLGPDENVVREYGAHERDLHEAARLVMPASSLRALGGAHA